MDFIKEAFSGGSYFIYLVGLFVLITIWFLPALLALIFNRKHFKLILAACVPAGFSFIAWFGVLLWATTGKALDKYSKSNS